MKIKKYQPRKKKNTEKRRRENIPLDASLNAQRFRHQLTATRTDGPLVRLRTRATFGTTTKTKELKNETKKKTNSTETPNQKRKETPESTTGTGTVTTALIGCLRINDVVVSQWVHRLSVPASRPPSFPCRSLFRFDQVKQNSIHLKLDSRTISYSFYDKFSCRNYWLECLRIEWKRPLLLKNVEKRSRHTRWTCNSAMAEIFVSSKQRV